MPGRQKTFAFQRREDPSEGKAGLFVGEKQESEGSHSWGMRDTMEEKNLGKKEEGRGAPGEARQGKARAKSK